MIDETRVQKLPDIPAVPPVPQPSPPGRRSRRTLFLASVAVVALVFGAGAFYLLRHTPGEPRPVPVPVAVAVVASCPGMSAEDVEKQVVVALEVALSGLPREAIVWSKALPGVARVRVEFEDGTDYQAARQEVINRLQFVQGLPNGVSPLIAPAPGWELLWYTLSGPRDVRGRPTYTMQDLQAVQESIVERALARVPGVAGTSGLGGRRRRYEVQLDPQRMRRYGITLAQIAGAIAGGNGNAGGGVALNVRGIGLFGGGNDPLQQSLHARDAATAAARLRAAEAKEILKIRQTSVVTIHNVPVRVEDLVEGGPLMPGVAADRGVIVGPMERRQSAGVSGPGPREEDDVIWGVVWMRPGSEAVTVLRDVRTRLQELTDTPGQLLPGVRVEPFHGNISCGFRPRPDVGPLWVHGTTQNVMSAEDAADYARRARKVLHDSPGVEAVLARAGQLEDGADPAAGYGVQLLVRMQQPADPKDAHGARRVADMRDRLNQHVPGVEWSIGPQPWDPFLAAPGEQGLAIIGSNLDELERLPWRARNRVLRVTRGIDDIYHFPIFIGSSLVVRIDRAKCARWGVRVKDVNDTILAAIDGLPVTDVVEGGRQCPIVLRWPRAGRGDEQAILDAEVRVDPGPPPVGLRPGMPAAPRLRVRNFLDLPNQAGPGAGLLQTQAVAIYRRNGERVSILRFRVRGRDEAEALAEVERGLAPLVPPPNRVEWLNR